MNEHYQNKIAVITGAAKGIGRALAFKCAALQMQLALADIDGDALAQVVEELKKNNIKVLSQIIDLSQSEQVHIFAERVFTELGIPTLLFNNAGIGGYVGPIWELSAEKIRWSMDINFMSVVYGIQAFVPTMIKANLPAHIINTASMAGLYSFPYFSTYIISKHAVVALSECMYHDLQAANAPIHVSVLCPGGVNTNILEGSKNYPYLRGDEEFLENYNATDARAIANFARMVRRGVTPESIADKVFADIAENKFYIFTHPELKSVVENRLTHIVEEKNPGKLDLLKVFE